MHSPLKSSTSAIQADIRSPNEASRRAALLRAECSPSSALVPDIIAAYAVENYGQCRIAALSALMRHNLGEEQLERVIEAYHQHAEKPRDDGKVHQFIKAPELSALMCIVAKQAAAGELPLKAQELIAQSLSSDVYPATVGAWASVSGEVADKHSAEICQALTQLAVNPGGLEVLLGGAQHPLVQAMQRCADLAKLRKPIAGSLHDVSLGILKGGLLPSHMPAWVKQPLMFEAFRTYESLWGRMCSDSLLEYASAANQEGRLFYAAILGRELGRPDIARKVAALFPYKDQPTGICDDSHPGIQIPENLRTIAQAPFGEFKKAQNDAHRADILRVIYALGLRRSELNDVVMDGLKSSSIELKVLSLKILSGFILDGPVDTDRSKLPDFSPQLKSICLDETLDLSIRSYSLALLPKASRRREVADHTAVYENLIQATGQNERHLTTVIMATRLAQSYISPEKLAGIIQRQARIFDQSLNSSDSNLVRCATSLLSDTFSGVLAIFPRGVFGAAMGVIREFKKPSIMTFDFYHGLHRLGARFSAAFEYIRARKRAKEFSLPVRHFAARLTALKDSTNWRDRRDMRELFDNALRKVSEFRSR